MPQIDTKVTNPSVSISSSSVKLTSPSALAANAASVKIPNVDVVPPTPPKLNVSVAPTQTQATAKSVQSTPTGNVNSNVAKPNVGTPKTVTSPSEAAPKVTKVEENKKIETKTEKPEKNESVKIEKTVEAVKSDKTPANSNALASTTPIRTESKSKQNTSPNSTASNKNQSASKEKDKNDIIATVAKPTTEQVTKTPAAKSTKAPQTSTPTPNSIEVRAKRNRLKTIPYQSPTPEIELVSKISANEAINAHKKKVEEDKLTLFYK